MSVRHAWMSVGHARESVRHTHERVEDGVGELVELEDVSRILGRLERRRVEHHAAPLAYRVWDLGCGA